MPTLIFETLHGSRAYGLARGDSDTDLKGLLELDVSISGAEYGFDLTELVAFKREAREKTPLPEALDAHLRAGWPELEERLKSARERSALPDEPTNIEAIGAWLVERRLEALESPGR